MGSKVSTHREEIFQQETLEMEMTWLDGLGVAFDLSTYINNKIWLFLADSKVPIQFSVTVNDGTSGPNILVNLTPAETATLTPGVYDVRIKLEDALGGVFVLPDDQFITLIVKERTF